MRGTIRALALATILALPVCSFAACGPGAPPLAAAPGAGSAAAAAPDPQGEALPWPQPKLEEIAVVLPSGTQIVAELADDPLETEIGLMGRASLPPGHGMLLDKGTPTPMSIWMKNCLIPLDLVWIAEGGRIAAVVEDAPPCRADPCASYAPGVLSRYVLELPAGTIRTEGLRPGGLVRIIRVGAGARS
jgi:uncharacterized membrane protein (UPF0127 family)